MQYAAKKGTVMKKKLVAKAATNAMIMGRDYV